MSKNPNAPDIFLPNKKIKNLQNHWNETSRLDFYIDFETINTSVSNMDIIYLIGMVTKLPNGTFNYKPYMLNELTHEEEANMIEKWISDMNHLKKKYGYLPIKNRRTGANDKHYYTPNLFCWGNAEISMINALMKRMDKMNRSLSIPIEFIDMCKMFRTEPILVKGCKEGFSLKNILAKMVEHKLVEEIKYDEFCNRGDISIVKAIEYYKTKNPETQYKLIDYNKIDCMALMKIVNKVREFC